MNWTGLHVVLAAMGLVLPEVDAAVDVPDEIRSLADQRWAARTAKDWAKSDELRDELQAKGWIVKDGRDGYELAPA